MEKYMGYTEEEINAEPYNFWNRDREKEENEDRIVYYWKGKEVNGKRDYVKVYTAPESNSNEYILSGRYNGKGASKKANLAKGEKNKLKAKARCIKFMSQWHYHYDY